MRNTLTHEWDKTFPKSNQVVHSKVTFYNRYGILLAADLYQPKEKLKRALPAIIFSGPFGAVKEQSSGLYAQTLAERGFITLAFDPSFTGESGGNTRDTASPDIYTEDFSAAVDYLGLQPLVDRNRIGVMAICGLSGMAITAAASDSRIRAVATASMYDMSRSISLSYQDSYTQEQRHKIIDYVSQQRWEDTENHMPSRGYHEIPFDDNGNIIKRDRLFPATLPKDADPVIASFYDYYCTLRGFHSRSVNSVTAFTATTPASFFSFPLMYNLELLSPRPLMLIAGANAHSLYYSQDVYEKATTSKELVIIADADHVDLYDKTEKIPFSKIERFFKDNLRSQ
ncbi:alpha/beta hydrolase [Pantoea sp. Ap-959]|uniref:alpha/beta hydrolase n=1 Tax=unclassified Pantoea TaxID=2630326 RepID=UPI0011B0C680|nr:MULTISPECIES: alpha/beta hydrolase [unclassified Pantoea]NIG36083.1 alpha/beta hydrolase [Pantoea sp. Ap-959]